MTNYDITLLSVDSGFSYITYYMLKSFQRLHIDIPVIIIANKNNEYLNLLYNFKNVTIIDNIDNKLLKNANKEYLECSGSYEHSINLQYVIDNNYINTKYVWIVDNDIIFNKNIFADLNINDCCIANKIVGYDVIPNEININWATGVIAKFNNIENLKPINVCHNKYTFENLPDSIIYDRIMPQCVFIDMNILYNNKLVSDINDFQYSKYCVCDTFGIFTYNCLKNNIEYICNKNLTDGIIHIGNSTMNKTDINSYIERLKHLNNDNVYLDDYV